MPIRKMTISVALLATAVLMSNVLFAAPPAKDVNVVNKPTVTIDDTTPINVNVQGGAIAANVTVDNVGTNPVPVLDVDQPARQRFQDNLSPLIAPSGASGFDSLIVPADKILVIEYVSANSRPNFATPAGAFLQFIMTVTTAGVFSTHSIGLVVGLDSGVFSTGATFVLSQPVRLYADPGSTVTVSVIRNFTNTSNSFNQSVLISISGHFVDP